MVYLIKSYSPDGKREMILKRENFLFFHNFPTNFQQFSSNKFFCLLFQKQQKKTRK